MPASVASGGLAAAALERAARRRGLHASAGARVALAGRQAAQGDKVVLSLMSPVGGGHEHFVHAVGSGGGSGFELPGALDFRHVDEALLTMTEGESRTIAVDGLAWILSLEQVCTPRGWSLRHEPFAGARAGPAGLASEKARMLGQCGIVTLRGAEEGGLTKEQVALVSNATLGFTAQAIDCIGQQLTRDPNTILRYSDVVARTSHRLNVKIDALWDSTRFAFLHTGSIFHDVLREAFGTTDFRLTHCGALLARPAPDGLFNNINQAWHRDAPEEPVLSQKWDPFAVVVYIPLVDLHADNGATEFIVGSHRDGTDPGDAHAIQSSESRVVSTQGLDAGDVVIFDCRTCHRGLLHTAPARGVGALGLRPVLALNFGVGAWEDKEDANNWGSSPLVPKLGV